MATDRQDGAEPRPSSSGDGGERQEEQVYAALGALLGMLEVIATDDAAPLSPAQSQRLRGALATAQRLQDYVEALLTLAAEDLELRLRRVRISLRPLIEHALRGALRSLETQPVELRLPALETWGGEQARVDASRFDRALSALVAGLAHSVGSGGRIEVTVERSLAVARICVSGERADGEPPRLACGLLERALRRLLELHDGRLVFEAERARFMLELPLAEAP